jgi:hypothetical protein
VYQLLESYGILTPCMYITPLYVSPEMCDEDFSLDSVERASVRGGSVCASDKGVLYSLGPLVSCSVLGELSQARSSASIPLGFPPFKSQREVFV